MDFYDHPNGLRTDYTYDANDILTKIAHKDGAAELQSFTYAFDDVYNITKITHADGSYWDYEYDGRYRLTKAVRNNKPSPTISATWEYTYDDGDNLLTKVIPFEDNFDDGNLTGWTVNGTWDASAGYAHNSDDATWDSLYRSVSNDDLDIRFRYRLDNALDDTKRITVLIRNDDTAGTNVGIELKKGSARLVERTPTFAELDNNASAAITEGVWYNVRIVADDSDVTVWRGADDEMLDVILESTSATVLSGSLLNFSAGPDVESDYDDIRIIGTWLDETVTYFYNAANELTKITDYNGDTTFNYDAWGRTTKKTRGTDYVDYAYRYGGFLHEVDATNWLGGDKVTYDYGGDGARRERITDSGDYTWFNYSGSSLISEEDENVTTRGDGDLTRTYISSSDITGNDPSSGTVRYLVQDHLGSTRRLYDASKNPVGDLEYTPYGDDYLVSAPSVANQRFTGHGWDSDAHLYISPVRAYAPHSARWLSADALGMVDGPNMYAYVLGNPVNYTDPLGLEMDILDALDDILDSGSTPRAGSWLPRAPMINPAGVGAPGSYASFTDGIGDVLPFVPQFGCMNPAPDPVANRVGQGVGIALGMAVPLPFRGGKGASKYLPGRPPPRQPSLNPKCFAAGTLVRTPYGLTPIEQLRVGDSVIATDPVTNTQWIAEITAVHSHVVDEIMRLSIGDEVLLVTSEHPIWTDVGGWKRVTDITADDQLLSWIMERTGITKIERIGSEITVFNLEVGEIHTFHVSKLGILVHNKRLRGPKHFDRGEVMNVGPSRPGWLAGAELARLIARLLGGG